MFFSVGEFGIVYKAHLVRQTDGLETGWKSKAVAVKLLKGITEMIILLELTIST